MKRLQLKASLFRKESAYEPRNCVVEKIILIYGKSFDQFKKSLLQDNMYIKQYKDLMYIDLNDIEWLSSVKPASSF